MLTLALLLLPLIHYYPTGLMIGGELFGRCINVGLEIAPTFGLFAGVC